MRRCHPGMGATHRNTECWGLGGFRGERVREKGGGSIYVLNIYNKQDNRGC